MIIRTIAFLFFLSGFSTAYAQSVIGSWRSYLPFTEASNIAIAGNRIYCSTSGGLFYYNVADNSISKLSKEDGLSDTRISAMEYSAQENVLVIAYETSNIDIIQDNRITNLPDISLKSVPGDKNIYNISFKDNLAYLSTGFGIVVLDVARKEFSETYIIGEGGKSIKINQTIFYQNFIYAATDEGIYRADMNAPNLVDYNYWQRITGIPGFSGIFNTIATRDGKIYVNRKGFLGASDVIYAGDGTSWNVYPKLTTEYSPSICRRLSSFGENLIVVEKFSVYVYDKNDAVLKHFYTGEPRFATFNNNGDFYIADFVKGLLRNPDDYNLIEIAPEGPASINVSGMAVSDNALMIVPGGARSDYNNFFRNGEVYRLNDNRWNNWISTEYKDFYRIVVDPRNSERYFIASWGWGLLEFNGNELVKSYNIENSSLQNIIPGGDYVRLGGLAFDKNNNLWMTNSEVNHLVSVLTSEGEWIGFPINSLVNVPVIGKIFVTSNDHKWLLLPRSNGIFVMDDKGTFSDFTDDKYKRLSVVDNNNSLITNDIRSIAEDQNGNIWLGTNKGVLVYYSPSRVFDESLFYAQPIIIPRNDNSGFGDPLLGTETVTSVVVDGANRKWLGTANAGLFLVSADGMEQIHSFNTDNSPILSNTIIDIVINEKNGEVFIATDKGIISYKGDAISPAKGFSDVYVYPNPVRPEYQGDIVISGLVSDTRVKITDIGGNLVYETTSLGGQALWNGLNFRGDRVKTGVYLVFCADKDGVLSVVTKLLFIN
jgi:hypothetical protein